MWAQTYRQKCSSCGVEPREEVLRVEDGRIVFPGSTLELFHSRLTDEDLHAILQAAVSSLPLSELVLPYNNITSVGCKYLSEVLRRDLNTIMVIDLSYNSIESDGIDELANALASNRSVIQLNLSGNPLGGSCGDAFASILKQNCCLSTLDLHSIDLNLNALIPICHSLSQNTGLSTLRLGRPLISNPEDINYAAHYIGLGLRENVTLRELDLSYFNMYDRHFESLLPSLSLCGIIRLSLKGNKFSPGAGPLLAELLNARDNFDTLDISANRLGDVGAAALAHAVGQHTSLHALFLGNNGIGEKGLEALAEGVKNCASLQRLELWGNALDTPAAARMMFCIHEKLDRLEYTDFKVYFVDGSPAIYKTS
ncbi:unnamed protein product [Phytomonas sp. EM1]|nr:unnamed protein product [Phytomonas sp. EM1]|eukprot:CCW63726.1 unnamed protein product [Phytomonas sp. isolate EM1]